MSGKNNNKGSKDLIVIHIDRDFKKFLLQRFTFVMSKRFTFGMNHLNTIKIFKSVNLPYFSQL